MNVERNAEWIKKQRSDIINIINEIVNIVATQVLNPNDNPRYDIKFSLEIACRVIILTVYDNVTNARVDRSEIWSLDEVLDEGWILFKKKHMQERVNICLKELGVMKEMAVKYATLNDKNQS